MAANQLALYNAALAAIGERSLASGEANDASRALDEAWSRGNGAIRACLEQGLFNFSVRTIQIDEDAATTPGFGLQYAFDKPSDFVRLVQISLDEYFQVPLNDYEDERGFWYADSTPLYIRYVSDDASYGADLSLWTETFTRFVGLYLAVEIAPRLKADTDMASLEKRKKKALSDAKSKDAMNEPARFAPSGSWANARHRGMASRRDRGSRTTLTG